MALFLLTLIGITSFRSILRLTRDDQNIKHTQEVLTLAERVLHALEKEVASQRGFLITGDDYFLQTSGHPTTGSKEACEALAQLFAGNPVQQQRVTELMPLLDQRLAFSQRQVQLRKSGGLPATQELVLTGLGEQVAEKIRERVGEIEKEERSLLEKRTAQSKESAYTALGISVLGSVIAFILFGSGIWIFRRDLVRREQSEEALRRSEEFLDQIIASTPDCVKVLGLDLRLLSINESGQRLLEIDSLNDLESIVWIDCWQGRDQELAYEAVQTALEGGVGTFHGSCPTLRGTPKQWDVSVSPLRDAWGELEFLLVVSRDVTERKKAEEALRESESRFRRIFHDAAVAMEVAMPDGRFVQVNRAFCDLLGYSESELLTKSFNEVTHPEDRISLGLNPLNDLMRGSIATFRAEKRYLHKSGRTVWVDLNVSKVSDPEGKPLYFIAQIQDITERKHADQELHRLNAELEDRVLVRTEVLNLAMQELKAEVAERRRLEEEILTVREREQARIGQDLHDDLGQQLAGMAMLSHALATRLRTDSHPKASDAAQLKTFLTESISTTRNLAKSFYPVELERGGLIIALQDLARRTELFTRIRCEVRVDSAFQFEKAAAIHLYRIVQESVSNAIKHGKARHIAIECLARDGVSTLSVVDDGIGFKEPARDKRSGMGLHLFKYRARMIGAEIVVSSGEKGGCKVLCSIKGMYG